MHRITARALLSLIVAGCLTQSLFAGPAIGIAMANGVFRIDGSEVKGNASLFDGSEVTTAAVSSKLRVNGGARLELGTDSQAQVFADRAVLRKGAGQVEGPSAYSLDARFLHIRTSAPASIARVRLDEAGVIVSAVNGPVRVFNMSGVLLAKVAAGNNLRFEPQAVAQDTVEVTGCLLTKSGRYILVDQTTNQIFELRGKDLRAEVGNRVTVRGKVAGGGPPIEGASQAVTVLSASQSAPGGCLAVASAVGADPPAGSTPVTPGAPPAGAASSSGVNKAVILGVVIAGAAGGGLALAMSNNNKSK